MNRKWAWMLMVLFSFVGCDRITDLSSQAEFSKYIGKAYQTKMNLVAVDANGNRSDLILEEAGSLGVPPLERMKSFPYVENGITVVGVVPVGSLLKVTKIQRFQSTEHSIVDVFVDIQGKHPFGGKTIRADVLLDVVSGPEPKMDPKYVEEVPAPSGK